MLRFTLLCSLSLALTASCMIVESRTTATSSGRSNACDTTYGDGDCKYFVNGVVVATASGTPISNAEVSLGDDLDYTDVYGQFGINVYAIPGCYQLIISHSDYEPTYFAVTLGQHDLTVGPVELDSRHSP